MVDLGGAWLQITCPCSEAFAGSEPDFRKVSFSTQPSDVKWIQVALHRGERVNAVDLYRPEDNPVPYRRELD